MQKLIILAFVFLSIVLINAPLQAGGGSPGAMASDFTKIKLTILQETISSDEDLTVLEPGLYEFIVANKTSEKELFDLAILAGINQDFIRISYEEEGVNLFLHIINT